MTFENKLLIQATSDLQPLMFIKSIVQLFLYDVGGYADFDDSYSGLVVHETVMSGTSYQRFRT
jgi:hypothetical protein